MARSVSKKNPDNLLHSAGAMPAKVFRALSNAILFCANRSVSCIDFLREIVQMLTTFSRCDEIQLHIKKDDECYRFKLQQSSGHIGDVEFTHNNYKNTQKNSTGGLLNGSDRNGFEIFRNAIREQSRAAASPGFTEYGSFWTGNADRAQVDSPSLSFLRDELYHGPDQSYLSLALIPLIGRDEAIGLMVLKSKAANYFTEEEIESYENIAQKIVLAFVNLCTHANLCERVKELTCLYNLAQLNERPNSTLEEILQGIVELLPSAWQYPAIAAGRIVFDGRSYLTANYQPSEYRQASDILIQGERRGSIEVAYREEKPELYEGPFLKEERNLLDVLARQISLLIQRRQADEEKTLLQDQLRHADRLATIGQLSAGVAHELNEPLGAILGFAQLAKKHPEVSAPVSRDLDKIVTTTLHAREIVKKLMYFARQTPPRKIKVNLNSVVEETLSLLESRCVHNNITLIRQLSSDLPEIDGDPSQLQQVVVNLVVNAIQAMPEGGTLTLTTEAADLELRLIVRDTGIGMSDDVIRQLFIPFFTTKDIKEGTGLGLPVVHGIVTAHGGTIHVESVPQQGSRFEIRFPVLAKPGRECNADVIAAP